MPAHLFYIFYFTASFLRILFRGVHFVQCFLGYSFVHSRNLSGLYILYSRFLLRIRKVLSVWCIYVTQGTETIHFVQSLRYHHFVTDNRHFVTVRLITRFYCKLTATGLFYGYFTGFRFFSRGGIPNQRCYYTFRTVHSLLYILYTPTL